MKVLIRSKSKKSQKSSIIATLKSAKTIWVQTSVLTNNADVCLVQNANRTELIVNLKTALKLSVEYSASRPTADKCLTCQMRAVNCPATATVICVIQTSAPPLNACNVQKTFAVVPTARFKLGNSNSVSQVPVI